MSDLQKIVYPSASVQAGGTVLNFVYSGCNVSAYIPEEVREDDYSDYGDHQSVLERIDLFLEFDVPWIRAGQDLTNWTNFLNWAAQGGNFDFYPDKDSSICTVYHLVSKGNKIVYRSAGFYKLGTLRLRQVIF
jgi:hypothetical protein